MKLQLCLERRQVAEYQSVGRLILFRDLTIRNERGYADC